MSFGWKSHSWVREAIMKIKYERATTVRQHTGKMKKKRDKATHTCLNAICNYVTKVMIKV